METDCLDDTTGATSDSRVGNHPIEKAGKGSTEGSSDQPNVNGVLKLHVHKKRMSTLCITISRFNVYF